jgi:hypothetical protein
LSLAVDWILKMLPSLPPEEFIRRAAEAGLTISEEHVAEMEVPGYSPVAAYQAIRAIDYSTDEPAVIFHPLRRGGDRS